MNELIKTLHSGNYSCVIRSLDEIYTFSQRGVADLYDLVNNKPDFLKGASIADKIVGKAAAALMISGGITELYAEVISSPALTLIREAGIAVSFGQVVPFIENRDKTDWCPLEKMCSDETSAESIFPRITEFIEKMKEKHLVQGTGCRANGTG